MLSPITYIVSTFEDLLMVGMDKPEKLWNYPLNGLLEMNETHKPFFTWCIDIFYAD